MKPKLSAVEALGLLLDQVDYTQGACIVTEMVGAVLPKEVLALCRETFAYERAHGERSGTEPAR